jgi:dipicolinate synthase subunit A
MTRSITIFGGAIAPEFKTILKTKNIKYFNIMLNEDFVLKNATLTAEGMLCDLILNSPNSMYEQNILIIGSGRVAKAVGYLFLKLGLNFDFAMRNEKEYNLTKLFAKKCFLGEEYKNYLKNYDVVINTVPAVIFNQSDIEKFKKDCYVFELASKRCLEGLKVQNVNYVLCPALPSKYTPKSAGKLIVELIDNYIVKGEV